MTYRVLYGDAVSMASREPHLNEQVRLERFSTEHEALSRARELIDEDATTVVAVSDGGDNQLSGLRLQLRLGLCVE